MPDSLSVPVGHTFVGIIYCKGCTDALLLDRYVRAKEAHTHTDKHHPNFSFAPTGRAEYFYTASDQKGNNHSAKNKKKKEKVIRKITLGPQTKKKII